MVLYCRTGESLQSAIVIHKGFGSHPIATMATRSSSNPAANDVLRPQKESRWSVGIRSLKHRNFQLFFSGQLISLTGTWMQTVAQSWLVYRLTGSSLLLGGVGFAIYRSRKRGELPQKAKRLRTAFRRAVEEPEKVARAEPPVWQKMAAAVGTTIAVSLAKKMVERTWNSTVEAGRT